MNSSKFSFDIRGYLIPAGENESNLEEVKELFVDSFTDESSRSVLFEGYLKYNRDLKHLIEAQNYEQWIDGSFVSQKINPNDIDVVSFIDHGMVEKYEKELQRFIKLESKNNYGVDGYVVKIYPEEHPHYVRTKSDLVYWRHLFSTTKPDRRKKKYGKGFLKLTF